MSRMIDPQSGELLTAPMLPEAPQRAVEGRLCDPPTWRLEGLPTEPVEAFEFRGRHYVRRPGKPNAR